MTQAQAVAATSTWPEGRRITPIRIEADSSEARARRADSQRRSLLMLEQVEQSEGARFSSANAMLSWFWAIRDHMHSPPAIDPSREIIQGLKVDRDERIFWVGKTLELLERLDREHGTRPRYLLWLHFRSPRKVGYRELDGRKVERYGDPGIAIRELHEHDGEDISRDKTVADFWRALHLLEEMAYARGWIAHRIQRKLGRAQVYRRQAG